MKKFLIWDSPTRLFHWAFAASIVLAFVFAFAVDDDSPLFQLHMLFGLVAVSLLVIRVGLALLGSRHVRLTRFPLRPAEVVRYFAGIFTGQARKYPGHNPGSALAALAMFALVPALVFTGALGGGEAFEEAHEVFAYALLAVIGAHLLGLLLHTLRHRENIGWSMVDGRKVVAPEEAIGSSHRLWGVALGAAAVAWSVGLFTNHDPRTATVRLPLVGTVVQLGENEGGEGEHRDGARGERSGGKGHRAGHDDDDD